jgi:hypothetical protein
MYDEMFAQLVVKRTERGDTLDDLRDALRYLGRFLRANRPMIARVMADALCGEPIAIEFLRKNAPRHLGFLHQLIELGQKDGSVAKMPVAQALGFCAGSLAMPIIFGGAVAERGGLPSRAARALENDLLSDKAIDQRIDLALAAISKKKR